MESLESGALFFNIALVVVLAVLLDAVLGEPKRWHPLVGFGRLAMGLERVLNLGEGVSVVLARCLGVLAVVVLVVPITLAVAVLLSRSPVPHVVDALLLYFTLGHNSLKQHARRIYAPLRAGDLAQARAAMAMIVSRDTKAMQSTDMAKATIESVLENGNDAVFGALFWFVVAGAPGALLYRLSNTLDAMWGYKTPRFLSFGWAAARLDDGLNYLPARLTAITYALLGGQFKTAVTCWRAQAPTWESPNAGPVMAAGAGSLGVQIGGPAHYHGVLKDRPWLGSGPIADTADIPRAMVLLDKSVVLWLAVIVLACVVLSAQTLFGGARVAPWG